MKIGIIGAGSTGCIYASYLCSCHDVYLFDNNAETVKAISANGLKIIHNDEEKIFHPMISSNDQKIGICDMVIVAVKTYQSSQALEAAKGLLNSNTILLSLQNGLNNELPILDYAPMENILLGSCAQGGTKIEPGVIHHVGAGPTEIGSICKNHTIELVAVEALREAAVPFLTVSDDIFRSIWCKAIKNAGMNSVTALVRSTTDVVEINPYAKKVCTLAVEEGVKVANALGFDISIEKMLGSIRKGAERNGKNRTSMLQDVENKRVTEVLSINGEIVAKGEKLGIPTPANELLCSLISAIDYGLGEG